MRSRPAVWLMAALFSALLVSLAEAAPEEADEAFRTCSQRLREEMRRYGVERLDPKVEHVAAGLCRAGKTEEAIVFAIPAAGPESCSRQVKAAADRPGSQLGEDEIRQAYMLCRKGELEEALALIEPSPPAAPQTAPTTAPTTTPAVKPTIFRFSATPPVIRAGQISRVEWDVYGAERVVFEGETVPARGSKAMRPKRTTAFSLGATSTAGSVVEKLTVGVSPHPLPRLTPPVAGIELCRAVDTSGGDYRCISPDGPFWAGDPVHVIVRFAQIEEGDYGLEYELFAGKDMTAKGWRQQDHATGPFHYERGGIAAVAFELRSTGKGMRKLELVFDGDPTAKSEIRYCVECPGHDEW